MQKIDIGQLQLIISKLKLKRPIFLQKDKHQQEHYSSTNRHEFSFSRQEQSVVQDNYSDSKCFSFYNSQGQNNKNNQLLTSLQSQKQSQVGQFSSIIDKLKTEGDLTGSEESFQYKKLDLNKDIKGSKKIDRQFYFSQKQIMLHAKSYKNISSMKKKKLEEPASISAKLVLDKQNFHIYSNQSHHSSVKKLKKTFNLKTERHQNSINNKKKRLQKTTIQIQNNGLLDQTKKSVSRYEMQCKTASPLPFRHSKIEPHKFSSYKMKLF